MIQRLENKPYNMSFKELSLFRISERRLRADWITVYIYLHMEKLPNGVEKVFPSCRQRHSKIQYLEVGQTQP